MKTEAKTTKTEREMTEGASMGHTIDRLLDKAIAAHPEHSEEYKAAKGRNAAANGGR